MSKERRERERKKIIIKQIPSKYYQEMSLIIRDDAKKRN